MDDQTLGHIERLDKRINELTVRHGDSLERLQRNINKLEREISELRDAQRD